MSLATNKSADRAALLDYRAPFLIEKLLKDRIVDTSEEGEELFTEVKKYLLLVRDDRTTTWEMYSLRVDEVWHQFILYTREYMDFCEAFFGRYVPHSPSNSPEPSTGNPTSQEEEVCTFELFAKHYQEFFGATLPDVWYDERSITTGRRVLNDHVGKLVLVNHLDFVDLLGAEGDVLFSVNPLARDALDFAARTGSFYVRELPGDLTDEEKVALVSSLVECRLLRIGS
jgi:hypothetical protein